MYKQVLRGITVTLMALPLVGCGSSNGSLLTQTLINDSANNNEYSIEPFLSNVWNSSSNPCACEIFEMQTGATPMTKGTYRIATSLACTRAYTPVYMKGAPRACED